MHENLCRPFTVALILALTGCGSEGDGASTEAVTIEAASRASVVMTLPLTSETPAAIEHFMRGQRDADMGRPQRALEHFVAAVGEDDAMALAHLRAAQWANSFADYRMHLEEAERLADGASAAERLLIRIERAGFDGNREAQLGLAEELVALAPNSPRAWLVLAAAQDGLNRIEEARASLERAIQETPEFALAQLVLANSLMLRDPQDLARAEEHARLAIGLEPGEAFPQDIMGDVHRAAGDFEAARAAYARAAELDAESGAALQQLGHVNSFLGAFDEARANYDEAIARSEGNARASFASWRALVHLHEGSPQGAIDELNVLVDAVDGMGIPEPVGVKITTLTRIAAIGLHANLIAQAENALNRRSELMRMWIEEVATDDFRRAQEADIAFWDGLVAVANGNYSIADAKAREIMDLRAEDADPRRFESAHDLLGVSGLAQGDYAAALEHLEQGNTNEQLGHTTEAQALYRGIADNRFNSVDVALLRASAIEKAM
jgi:tetratricopeptide (TPR) repeat protein